MALKRGVFWPKEGSPEKALGPQEQLTAGLGQLWEMGRGGREVVKVTWDHHLGSVEQERDGGHMNHPGFYGGHTRPLEA